MSAAGLNAASEVIHSAGDELAVRGIFDRGQAWHHGQAPL